MAKISNQLSTEISLDTIKAATSLKSLQSAITATSNTWKNLSAAQKSTGDSLGALETKASGLSKTMQLQQQRIDELKNKQKELTNGMGITADTTEKVKQKYQSYQNQINRLVAQQAAEKSQLEQVNSQMKYHESGLASLQSSMKNTQALTQATVEKLRAEGKTYQATAEKIKGLDKAYENLSKQYQIQERELSELANSSGKASQAYQRQKIRLAETAAQMAKNRSQQKELNTTMLASNSTVAKVRDNFSKFGTTMKDNDTKAGKFTTSIKNTALGVGIANTAMAAMNVVTGQVGDAISRVDTLNNSKRVFQNMGYSAKDTNEAMKGLNKSIQGLPTGLDQAVQGVQMVAATTNNLKQGQKVWSALNDAVIGFGGSTAQVQEATVQLSQAFSNGKIDAQTWNSMMNAQLGPTLNAIAKDMGMTTAQLKSGLSDGKISVQQFQDELIKLDQKGGGGLKSLTQIAHDSTSGIQTAFTNAKTAITRGLGDLITNFSNSLQKVTGSNLSQIITDFGKKAETVLGNLGTFLGKIPEKIKPLEPAFQAIASIVKDVIGGAFEAIKPIVDPIVSGFQKMAGLKDGKGFNAISKTLSELASHHVAIQALGGAIVGVVGALGVIKTLSFIPTIISGISGAFETLTVVMMTNPFGVIAVAIAGVAAALITLYNKSAWFRDKVHDVFEAVKKTFQTVGETFSDIGKSIGNVFSGIASGASHCAEWVGSHFDSMVKSVQSATAKAKDFVKERWNDMKNAVSDAVTAISDKDSKLHDDMISKISDATGVSKKTLNDGYNVMSDYTTTFKDLVTGKWGKLGGDVKHTASDLASTAKGIFSGMYNRLNDLTGGGLGKIKDAWSKMWSNIIDGINSAVRNVGHAVSKVVNNVIDPINKMLDGVKSGVNWVLDKFGASKWSGYHIPEVHLATGGTVGKGGTMALVNDAPGKNYREMFATPDGKIGAFPKDRNVHTFLPEGTQVLDGERSKQLADMLEIPHFKDGTKDKGLFGNIFDKAFDLFDKIKDVIAHPFEFLEEALDKNLHISTNVKFAADMIAKAPSFFAKQGMNWLKKMAEDFKKKKDQEVVSKNIGPGAGNWADVIRKVADATHTSVSDSDMQALLARIQKESGGNQSIKQQIVDINSINGNPAQGLFQYIPPTFAYWAVPGHNNILSGEDQIYAVFNDSNWRSDIRMPGGWGPTGHKMFANGGFVNGATNAIIGEAGPEVVIPLNANKQGRALDLLTSTVNKLNKNAGRRSQISTTDNSGIEKKLDTMIGLLGSLLGVNQQQLHASNGTPNLQGFYQKMYQDQQLSDYQAF